MANNEFVDWDDLDLDDILGDYTEDDAVPDEDEWSDYAPECDSDGRAREAIMVQAKPKAKPTVQKKPRARKNKPKSIFGCPLCSKTYVSISGFRGHMLRKHDRGDIRAHQHIVEDNAQPTDNPVSPTPASVPSACVTTEEVEVILRKSVPSAVESIIACPKNNSNKSRHGSNLIQAAKILRGKAAPVTDAILPHLKDIAGILIEGKFSSTHVEKAYTRFHLMRIDKNMEKTVCEGMDIGERTAALFTQAVLRRAMDYIVEDLKANISAKNVSSNTPEVLSENDQSVLFYVSGYLARKCLKVIPDATFTAKSAPTNFLENASEWVGKVTRGGLLIPSEDFFLLVREFEMIMRKSYNPKLLNAQSLSRVVLMDYFFDSFMVQHYWRKLGSHPERGLEYLAKLFLTVRGYAMTRKIRNDKTGGKSAKSLRQSLHK